MSLKVKDDFLLGNPSVSSSRVPLALFVCPMENAGDAGAIE